MSELLWVAVPGGLRAPSTARIRVLVVPRLGAGSLADFGLQDWPGLLADASFELQVKTAEGIRDANSAPVYDPVADSDAWHAFFDGDAGLLDEWSPKEQPVPQVRPTYADARAVVTSYRECTSFLAVPAPGAEAAVRQRIERWHTPPPPSVQVEEPLPPFPPAIDFHQAVATLREHPTVLSALGLVFELSAEVADLDIGTGPRFLRIRCPDPPLSDLITTPWTKYDLAEGAFWPAPADGSSGIHRGLLKLDGVGLLDWAGPTTPRWALTTLDVDGAVRALRTEARALDGGDGERQPALPGLRTGGLSLIRPDRQFDFTARAGIASGRVGASLENAELTAEDLVLGYRVDIRAGDSPWLSLCERKATYTVEASDGQTIALGDSTRREEGHIKPYAAVKTPDGRLHADEVVVRWDGWSLAVPFMNLLGGDPVREPDPAQAPPYTLCWDFCPPDGSLPRLRFATRYQMRIRIADLTGGGPGLEEPQGTTGASETIFYTRNDPIRPPRLSHDGVFGTGAAVDRLVIRSDLDMTVAQFHAANPQYPEVERRTLHPPTVSFSLAEQHGMLDPRGPEDSGPQFTERTWKQALRALSAEASGDPDGALPDPATSGISAHVPAAPGGLDAPLTERTNWPPWPSGDSKQIELAEQLTPSPPVRLDWEGNTLEIRLARAEEAVLELSSTVRDGFIDHFAVTSWLNRPVEIPGVPRPPLDQWQVTVLNGRHSLLSPVRRIHLVHAVRKPLADPVWQLSGGSVIRAPGSTNVLLRPVFSATGLNTDSTGRLEISATWREWTNDGDRQRSIDYLHGEALPRGAPPALAVRHEFGDTKHRKVTYTLKAISRYRAYFDAGDPDDAFQVTRPQPTVTILSSARPPDLALLSTTPSFRWQSQTTPTRIERSRSSQRLRVELTGRWYETGEGERFALLAAADGAAPAVPVTRLGRDPVFASAPLPPLAGKSWFAGFSEPPVPSAPMDLGASVWLVPYIPIREGDRWYADIELNPPQTPPSYAPFVKLALARYQPGSLPGLSLSPIVESDLVRLLPDRRLIVERAGPDLRLSLLGTGPNPPNRMEAILEEAHLLPGVRPEAIDLVDLTTPPSPDIPAWRPLPSHALTTDRPETPSTLRMPSGTAPLRLRVREVERLDAPLASTSPAELRDRTVFVDTVLLPADWRPS